MSSRTTVSVVVPSYNRAHCLPDTIASVLGQTVAPLEVLVVDDGSRDDTRDVVGRYPAPVRYIWRPNGGSAAARNTGMREAKGQFLAFLDADDVWEPTKLEIQLGLHAAHPELGWSITDHRTTDGAGRPLAGPQGFVRDFPAFRDTGLDPDSFFARTMVRSALDAACARHAVYTGDAYELLFDGNIAFPSCVVLQRELMDRAGLFDEGLPCAVDTEYFHRLAAAAPLGVVMTPLFRWRRGEGETIVSSANMVRLVETALLSLDRALVLRGEPSALVRQRHLASKRRLLLRLAYMHLSELNGAEARAALHRAWAAGARLTLWAAGVYGASLLPRSLLRALRQAKRTGRR